MWRRPPEASQTVQYFLPFYCENYLHVQTGNNRKHMRINISAKIQLYDLHSLLPSAAPRKIFLINIFIAYVLKLNQHLLF